ncbi:MAG: DMT family transporter [Sulfuriferula sp.]|nr:DMT family transporter [Sulfuriferula sp.]
MHTAPKNLVLPIIALLISATLWGAIWYPYRWLSEMGVSGLMSSFITYGIALILGLPFYFKHLRTVSHAKWLWLAIVISSGWTNTAYVLAVIDGEVMRVALLFYLAPLWTVLFARLFLGERLHDMGYIVIGLSFTGALVMLWQADGRLPLPANLAEWMGLSAGMSFALTNVLAKKSSTISIQAKSIGIWIGGVLVSLPLILWQGQGFHAWATYTPVVWGVLVVVALSMVGVTLCIQYGLMHVAANRAIVILVFELIISAITAYWLAHESLTAQEWVGAAMIMVASLFSGQLEQKEPT